MRLFTPPLPPPPFQPVCHINQQERNGAAKGRLAAKIIKQPMFCFETAIKLFFFSSFVYTDYNAVRLRATDWLVVLLL